jgi:hypothetical protein
VGVAVRARPPRGGGGGYVSATLVVYHGGLMRCCLASIDDYDGPQEIGTRIPCKYHADQEPVAEIVADKEFGKAWRWVGPKEGR